MQSIGFPLVGDSQYGWRRVVPRGADATMVATIRDFSRQALHAAKLQFQHPRAAKLMSYSAPMPQDILQLAQMLADDAD